MTILSCRDFYNERMSYPEDTSVEMICDTTSPNFNKDIMQAVVERMDLGDLNPSYAVDTQSNLFAGRVLSSKAKEAFPDLAGVAGLIPPSVINERKQRIHEMAEKCGCSLALFEQEKVSPTFTGTRQLEEYLDDRSTLIVWQKLADAIGNNTKPDLSNLTSAADFQSEANKFNSWFNTNIVQLTSLQTLLLPDNNLTSLPSEFSQLTSLLSLDLTNNNLTSFSSEISQLASLKELSLTNNNLSSLPPEIGNLLNLDLLLVGNNNLTDLPPEVGLLTSLEILYLDHNNLGSLPSEFYQLTSLEVLHLNHNNLTSLPPEIDQLTSLQDCNLHYNQLTDLPHEFNHLKGVATCILKNPMAWQSFFSYASPIDYLPLMPLAFAVLFVAQGNTLLGLGTGCITMGFYSGKPLFYPYF